MPRAVDPVGPARRRTTEMLMRAATMLCLLVVTAMGAACGGETQVPASPAAHERAGAARVATARGVTVVLPTGWRRARESLTPALTDPREVLSVATFPLRYRHTQCAQVPGAALLDLGPE